MTEELLDAPPTQTTPPAAMPAPADHPSTRADDGHSGAAAAAAVLAAAALAACGGGGGGGTTAAVVVDGRGVNLPTAGLTYLVPANDAEAARFLQQAQFSATEADIASVRSLGYAPWLQRQIAMGYTTGWDWLVSKGYSDPTNPGNYYDATSPADYMVWSQLASAPDALRKRAALALSEFFVVSLSGISATWPAFLITHYWDTLNQHALGNFRDLLQAITLNPAMGYFLNTKGNLKENSSGRQPDENYAREVMQLFSVGLNLLDNQGVPLRDGSGNTTDTYSSSDVSNLARVFTGYDLDQSQNVNTVIPQTGGGTRTVSNTEFARLPMVQKGSNHSTLAATLLGTAGVVGAAGPTIPANASAAAALTTAMDTLFNHPNTAPFFCKQMIQRLVTSNPSAAYVGRVTAVFINNGAGVRGDLAYVFAAILMDNEARGPAGLTDGEFGKLREPMVRLVQWLRTFGVTSTSGAWKIGDLSNAGTQLGQSPLRAPSVFNYYRPGYVHPATTLSAGKVSPEFQIVNESSVGGYLVYMMGVISNGISSGDIKATYTSELALVLAPTALVNRLNTLLCAGQLSAGTVSTIVATLNATALTSTSSDANKRNRVCAAVLMVMAGAEYLIQK
jgi:uncharacterized protein (DUF1800 family)